MNNHIILLMPIILLSFIIISIVLERCVFFYQNLYYSKKSFHKVLVYLRENELDKALVMFNKNPCSEARIFKEAYSDLVEFYPQDVIEKRFLSQSLKEEFLYKKFLFTLSFLSYMMIFLGIFSFSMYCYYHMSLFNIEEQFSLQYVFQIFLNGFSNIIISFSLACFSFLFHSYFKYVLFNLKQRILLLEAEFFRYYALNKKTLTLG